MSTGTFAYAGAAIGFAASIIALIVKEFFDRRRQRRSAINTLSLMSGSLRNNLKVPPTDVPHLQIDKMTGVLNELAASDALFRAYLNYDEALRLYREAWRTNPDGPGCASIDEIYEKLNAIEATLRLWLPERRAIA